MAIATATAMNPTSLDPCVLSTVTGGADDPTPSGPTTGDRVKGCLIGGAVGGLTRAWGGPWVAAGGAIGGCIAGAIMPTGKAY
jgi:hypothetical protein